MSAPAPNEAPRKPVGVMRPPAFSALLGPGGKEWKKFFREYDEREKAVAAAMEKFRKEGGSLRQAVELFAGEYEFFDKGRFVGGLSDRIERLWPAPEQQSGVEKFPDSMYLNRFFVSAFMLYEFTNNQDVAICAVDFCVARSGGNGGAASIHSLLLASIAGDAFTAAARRNAPQDAMAGNLPDKANLASQESARNALEKTLGVVSGYRGDARDLLHVMSAVSSLACRVEPCGDRMKTLRMGRLPMPCRCPYASFLRAMENMMALSAAHPAMMGEFRDAVMEAHRMRRDDLLFGAAAIIGWAANLSPKENLMMARDALSALRGQDREYLLALEDGLLRLPGMLAHVMHSKTE